ncbi:MAG: PAS domain S-box protein, partial [bacterium]
MLTEMHKMGLKVQETAQAIQEAGWQGMDTSKAIAVIKTKRAIITGTLVAVITLITGILAAFFMARGIAGPIKELKQATDRIAEGDLKHRVRITSSDEIGELGISFNKMSESLQNTMISRDYFENVIRSTLDTLIVLDKEARIQTVNPATCELLGYTEEELIGQPASILFAEEEEEEEVFRVFQFFREPEKAGAIHPQDTIRNRELTYKTKDGRLIPMLFNASVIREKMGNITGVVAGAKDITDLKLAEAEIRKEKTLSEKIIATIPDSLLVLDKDLRIKKANRSFYEVFGVEREKAIGARITDILGDEDGRLSSELTRLLGTEDNIEYFELHYPSEKRGERIFSITARNIIFAEEEEEEEELLVITDITERKRSEEALRESEARFRAMTESTSDAIVSSNSEGKITFWNNGAKEIFGYEEEEILGKPIQILLPGRLRDADKEGMEDFLETGASPLIGRAVESICLKKDGSEFPAEISRFGYKIGGESFIGAIIRDVTQHKKAEEEKAKLEAQLRQSQKMEAIG